MESRSQLIDPGTASSLDRRGFCACALAAGSMAALSSCGGGGGGGASAPVTPPPPPATTVTTSETRAGLLAAPAGTARNYTATANLCPLTVGTAQGFYLVRDAAGIFAVSASCLHLGGRIDPVAGGFHCNCHGSSYDPNGTVTVGPAPIGSTLPHFTVTEPSAGAFLVVDTSRLVGADVRLS
jgi:Rieske Fe-S protein